MVDVKLQFNSIHAALIDFRQEYPRAARLSSMFFVRQIPLSSEAVASIKEIEKLCSDSRLAYIETPD